MKARTRAQKLKQKRGGRPRLDINVERYPSGDRHYPSQSERKEMSEAEARSVVVERRIREGKILPFKSKDGKLITAEEQAIDPRRGYTLGLMLLDGTIQDFHHEAGIRYAEDVSRYLGLKGIPFPSPRAQNLFSIRGHDGEESESRIEAAQKAQERFNKLRKVLLETGDIDTGRKVERKVAELCVQDMIEARTWPEPTLLLAKWGLRNLAFYYGLVDAKK